MAKVFATVTHSRNSLIFAARLEFTGVEPHTAFNSNGRFPNLNQNIRLGWKLLTLTNTPVYYNTAKITAVIF
jgi:hypothetical protein